MNGLAVALCPCGHVCVVRFEPLSPFCLLVKRCIVPCCSRPVWSAQSGDLTSAEDALLEKVRLLSVMEQVFRRQAKDRAVPFSDLAAAANVPEDEVRSVQSCFLLVLCDVLIHNKILAFNSLMTISFTHACPLSVCEGGDACDEGAVAWPRARVD